MVLECRRKMERQGEEGDYKRNRVVGVSVKRGCENEGSSLSIHDLSLLLFFF
jgi:hypothetical protein